MPIKIANTNQNIDLIEKFDKYYNFAEFNTKKIPTLTSKLLHGKETLLKKYGDEIYDLSDLPDINQQNSHIKYPTYIDFISNLKKYSITPGKNNAPITDSKYLGLVLIGNVLRYISLTESLIKRFHLLKKLEKFIVYLISQNVSLIGGDKISDQFTDILQDSRDKITKLIEHVKTIEIENANAQKKIAELSTAYQKQMVLTNENSEIIRTQNGTIAQAQQAIRQLTDTSKTLRETHKVQIQKIQAEAHAEIEALTQQLKDQTALIAINNETLLDKEQQIEELEKINSALKQASTSQTKRIEEIVRTSQKQIAELKRQSNYYSTANQQANKTIANKNQTLQSKNLEIKQKLQDINQLSEKVVFLEKEKVEQIKQVRLEMQKIIAKLQSTINEQVLLSEKNSASIKHQNNLLESKTEKIAQLESNVESLEKAGKSHNQQINFLQNYALSVSQLANTDISSGDNRMSLHSALLFKYNKNENGNYLGNDKDIQLIKNMKLIQDNLNVSINRLSDYRTQYKLYNKSAITFFHKHSAFGRRTADLFLSAWTSQVNKKIIDSFNTKIINLILKNNLTDQTLQESYHASMKEISVTIKDRILHLKEGNRHRHSFKTYLLAYLIEIQQKVNEIQKSPLPYPINFPESTQLPCFNQLIDVPDLNFVYRMKLGT